MIYFTSDLHLGHDKIIDFERIKFKTIEEHDNDIYKNISTLHSSDKLYILGDLGKIDPIKWHSYNIKCKIYLLKGNHDKSKDYIYNRFGIEIINFPMYYTERIIISHEPVLVEDDVLNLHGHLHCSRLDLKNYYNVNYYLNNCKFITIREVMSMLANIPKNKNKYKYGYEWWIKNQVILPEYREMKKEECFENGYLNIKYLRGEQDE